MIQLQAPWPAPSVTTLLPNPGFSDVEKRDQTVSTTRSMNNTLYSYARDGGTSLLTYTFLLSRMKSMELQRFVEVMIGQQILMTNHKNEQWVVTIANNPFEIQQSRRAVGPTGKESDSVTVQFEGIKI